MYIVPFREKFQFTPLSEERLFQTGEQKLDVVISIHAPQ